MVTANRRGVRVSIPLYPAEHFYVITEAIKDLPKDLPVLRDFDDSLYLKEDAGKLLVGIFEGKSIPAFEKTNKVPNDFSFGEFPENFDHFEPYLEASFKRVPLLENAGIRKKNRFFCGIKIKWCLVHSNNQRTMAGTTKTSNYSTIV